MIQIIAHLYVGERGIEGLREFESRAIPILKEHSGELISASFNANKTADEADEIHVIQFPSLKHFDAYKSDSRLLELSELRSQMIRKTEVFMTDRFHQY